MVRKYGTARSEVVESWEEQPNIWLTVAKDAFIGWTLNIRVPMLLKGAVKRNWLVKRDCTFYIMYNICSYFLYLLSFPCISSMLSSFTFSFPFFICEYAAANLEKSATLAAAHVFKISRFHCDKSHICFLLFSVYCFLCNQNGINKDLMWFDLVLGHQACWTTDRAEGEWGGGGGGESGHCVEQPRSQGLSTESLSSLGFNRVVGISNR